MRPTLEAGALAVLLAGCITVGQDEPQRHYVLDPPRADQAPADSQTRKATLHVAPMTASAFYETPQIVYSRAPGERAYYLHSTWTEQPARRITQLLVSRLARAQAFDTVAYAASGVRGDLVLNTHLAAFYHDAAVPPGHVEVALTAELVDPTKRTLLARESFRRSAPAARYDAAGAVDAFNRAMDQMLDDIAAWVDSTAPR